MAGSTLENGMVDSFLVVLNLEASRVFMMESQVPLSFNSFLKTGNTSVSNACKNGNFLFHSFPNIEIMLDPMLHRIPVLDEAEIRQMVNGPESFTPDLCPVIGEVPEVHSVLTKYCILLSIMYSVALIPSPALILWRMMPTGIASYPGCACHVKGLGTRLGPEKKNNARVYKLFSLPSEHG